MHDLDLLNSRIDKYALYAKAGSLIELPERVVDRPNTEFLEWHMDERFKESA